MANSSTSSVDKQWAKAYILDPLTAPEPSQETGPGSSFLNPRRALSVKKDVKKEDNKLRKSQYPTPLTSSSPTRSQFHPSNPFSPNSHHGSLSSALSAEPADRTSGSRPRVGRSNSTNYPARSPDFHPHPGTSSGLGRSQSVRQPVGASASASAASGHGRSNSVTFDKGKGLHRSGSLNQRYPGDMSHRPLDMIKRDARAADRAPHLRRKGLPGTDTIDSLDSTAIGGTYHHSGPYDPTLISRNTNKMYSPVEAVRHSNMEALKATPKEYIQDSLTKHVPLQGTAIIPPGGTDMSGNVMKYDEGADLMREPDAPGGAYKRWDFVPYHPDDLKGKGEPSFTIERDLKENKARQRRHGQSHSTSGVAEYEMLPQRQPQQQSRSPIARKAVGGGAQVRQRSVSAAGDSRSYPQSPGSGLMSPTNLTSPFRNSGGEGGGFSTNNDLRRSNTTGRRITDGLKRRFGSLRRKMGGDDA